MARKRRTFTAEFKAEAVRLCRAGDRTIRQVAADLDLTETALREWVKRATIDAGDAPGGELTTAEREELARLRRENRRLLMEREILKKAAANSTARRTAEGFSGVRLKGAPDGRTTKTRTQHTRESGALETMEARAVAE